ncbi:MAG: hypothetical protein K8I30_08070 [Anaerolineae bacterium]|nr:hypothetical protein [Anaerolineae bacterium]
MIGSGGICGKSGINSVDSRKLRKILNSHYHLSHHFSHIGDKGNFSAIPWGQLSRLAKKVLALARYAALGTSFSGSGRNHASAIAAAAAANQRLWFVGHFHNHDDDTHYNRRRDSAFDL